MAKDKIKELKKLIAEKGNTTETMTELLALIEKMDKDIKEAHGRCDDIENEVNAINEELDLMEEGMHIEEYEDPIQAVCPYCGEDIEIDLEEVQDEEEFKCPHCGKEIALEWDSPCDCGCEHDHDDCDCNDCGE